jgi:RNA polymerase sigma factor (sigma-70 family)
MTITDQCRPQISDHRYVLPVVREIARGVRASRYAEPASRTEPGDGQAAAPQTRPAAEAVELERVVSAASAGDSEAMSELVERFTGRVRIVARMYRLAGHDAEDVMQTTWLQLLQHVDSVRDPTAIGAWLETTARRESLRLLKTSSRERPTDDQLVFDVPSPPPDEQRLSIAERRAALATALARLTGRQRQVLTMLFAEPARSYTEISSALGIPVGSIGPTRERALVRLRREMARADPMATAA